ncbi:MAG: iron-containing alcohol dehydrogenase [Coriobacteriales bacterium]|jgi:alcohol dehydrogenase YqhD (iron-dependent ADH family)
MNDFTFCSPTKFVFGRKTCDRIGPEMTVLGMKRALLVYGRGSVVRTGTLDRVKASLADAGIESIECGGARPNPEVTFVRAGIEKARTEQVDCVLAVGGGSVIDSAKAIAFGVPYSGDVWDFFCGKDTVKECLPIAVVLTLPAAGSEGSGSCVISNDELSLKSGTNGDAFRPKLSIMDPELTFTLPAYQTAAGVTDMIAHICERFFSGVGAVPVTDDIATGLVRALIECAPRALENPEDYDARANIMWAGMLAHNDLAGCGRSLDPAKRAGGWESHGLEHELSAHHPEITHGAGLAVIMPTWMRYVWKSDPERFLLFGREVFGITPESEGTVERAVLATIDKLQGFFKSMGMPSTLGEFDLTSEDVEELLPTLEANKGATFGAFQKLTLDDARAIYLSAF